MHTLRFTVTQVLIKLTFKQPVNVAASCTVQGFIKLLIQQQDRGPVVEAFCMSRGCLLIRCGLQEPMREPVIAADGQTYEKAALKSWLQQHDTSPVTGQPFFFFFWVGELYHFIFFVWEGEIFITRSNDNNLKEQHRFVKYLCGPRSLHREDNSPVTQKKRRRRSQAQMACLMSSTPNSGRYSAQSCWQSCKKPSRLSMVSACQPP